MSEKIIGLAIWDGVEELDFAGPYEVLTAWANQQDEGMHVLTVAAANDTVRCAHGLQVVPDRRGPRSSGWTCCSYRAATPLLRSRTRASSSESRVLPKRGR